MDKKRAAMRQTRAIEQQAERLRAIEAAITQSAAPAAAAEIAPGEPMATAAHIEALSAQIDALSAHLDELLREMIGTTANRLASIEARLDQALKPQPAQQSNKR